MTKLAPAKEWYNRPIDKWLVTSFTEYLRDKHEEVFGIDYMPFGGTWGMEQGILGDLIGTKSRTNPKPRKVPNELVKEFIDEAFETYKPSKNYPGTSLGFTWTYRKEVWQRVQMRHNKEQERIERDKRAEQPHDETKIEVLTNWW